MILNLCLLLNPNNDIKFMFVVLNAIKSNRLKKTRIIIINTKIPKTIDPFYFFVTLWFDLYI